MPLPKKTPKWAFQDLWQFSFIPGTRVGMWFALLFIVAAFCCMAWGVVRLFAAGKASGPLPARNALAALAFAAFNVPASLNAAWLSAASVVAMLVVPASRGVARDAASVVWLGVALCAAITALAVYVALVKVSSKKKLFFFSRKSGRPERKRGKEKKTQKTPLKIEKKKKKARRRLARDARLGPRRHRGRARRRRPHPCRGAGLHGRGRGGDGGGGSEGGAAEEGGSAARVRECARGDDRLGKTNACFVSSSSYFILHTRERREAVLRAPFSLSLSLSFSLSLETGKENENDSINK